nr:hypothetical protein [Cryptomonas sp. NIES-345]BDA98375.1 hypothetical protein [Cryptomonas sp. NIES-1327]
MINFFHHIFQKPNIQPTEAIPETLHRILESEQLSLKLRTDLDNLPTIAPLKKGIFILHETSHVLPSRNYSQVLNENQKYIEKQLRTLPMYVLVNNKNELIKASSFPQTEQKDLQKSSASSHDNYKTVSTRPIIPFFLNKQDAILYLHEVSNQEPENFELYGLKIKTVNGGFFYTVNRTHRSIVHATIVGDLTEIRSIIDNKISCEFHYDFNPKQKYSHNFFKGTPVYRLRLTQDFEKRLVTDISQKISKEKDIIFFRYKDVLSIWDIYKRSSRDSRSINKLNIEIFNLEDLILDMESSKLTELPKYTWVSPIMHHTITYPSKEDIQTLHSYSSLQKVLFNSQLTAKNLQRICTELFWLLTSNSLPNEEILS